MNVALVGSASVIALFVLTGCSFLSDHKDELEPAEKELVGQWSWTAPGAVDRQEVVLKDDRTSVTARPGDSTPTTGTWHANSNGNLFIEEHGLVDKKAVAMVPGCGAFVSDGRVFFRSEPSTSCLDTVPALSAKERCVAGSSRQYVKN